MSDKITESALEKFTVELYPLWRISLFDILCFLSYNFRHVNNDIYHAVIFAIACNCFDI